MNIKDCSFDNSDSFYDQSTKIVYDKVSEIVRTGCSVHRPKTKEELRSLIKESYIGKTTCSVVSGGRNWGYGGFLPVYNSTDIISLRHFKTIHSFDEELGIVHIDAGVTQGELQAYLLQNGLDFYVPTTGAGPYGSILGNALERGFGPAPMENHAESILSFSGYLCDGTEYTSAFDEVDSFLSTCFSEGIGPSLDRLIVQSSWLAITDVKIQLVKRSGQSSLALVSFTQSQWRLVIQFLQRNGVERILPIAGVKIIHKNQVRSKEREDHWVYSFVGQQEWTLLFFIRSEKKLHGSVLKQFQLQLRAIGLKKRDFSLKKINLYIWILRIIPLSFLEDLASAMENLREFYYLGDGRPSSVGHQVRNKSQGLVWLSPLCPLKEDRVHDLLQIVMSWNSSPILFSSTWTWTQLNQRTLALVIPLQFDKKTPQADVWKDYRAKLDLLKAKGFAPYRLPIECMDHFTNSIAPKHFELIRKVTRALNPEDNLSAGRYF